MVKKRGNGAVNLSDSKRIFRNVSIIILIIIILVAMYLILIPYLGSPFSSPILLAPAPSPSPGDICPDPTSTKTVQLGNRVCSCQEAVYTGANTVGGGVVLDKVLKVIRTWTEFANANNKCPERTITLYNARNIPNEFLVNNDCQLLAEAKTTTEMCNQARKIAQSSVAACKEGCKDTGITEISNDAKNNYCTIGVQRICVTPSPSPLPESL